MGEDPIGQTFQEKTEGFIDTFSGLKFGGSGHPSDAGGDV